MRRVVITGMAGLSPLANDWPGVLDALRRGHSGVRVMDEWQGVEGLQCYLGAPTAFEPKAHLKRRALRSMGRVAALAVHASELALEDAGLTGNAVLTGGRAGVAYGSATGSPDALLEFVSTMTRRDATELKATSYLRSMSHTAAVNIGVHFGMTGRMLTTSSACTASSQAIGFAFEQIRSGAQDVMLAGGADELTVVHSAVFDVLLATSTRNDAPHATPRPFDAARDGLVLGEGAGTLVLESLEHAEARNAKVLAEVVGFATNTDGHHITQPNAATQATCLRLALQNAGLQPRDIGYVSAHGTATTTGDVSECQATYDVLGPVPISSLKGHMGHTLGACGALEAQASVMMMREGWFAPTLNLESVDPDCAPLDFIQGEGRDIDARYVMSNNFAFGGINTSLIFRRPD